VKFDSLEMLSGAVGVDLGRSRMIPISQRRISDFAAVTEDRQWIHTDPERAAAGPFGATIAHGYLTLSLISAFVSDLFVVDNASSLINYGLDHVRFPAPVLVDSSLSATGKIRAVESRGTSVRVSIHIEIEEDQADRLACVADALVLVNW
jgi:acyl dehydratase